MGFSLLVRLKFPLDLSQTERLWYVLKAFPFRTLCFTECDTACRHQEPRTFLVRGSLLDVYRMGDDEVQYANATSRIKDLRETPFSPSKVQTRCSTACMHC